MPSWIIADDRGMSKYHISIALRTAIITHVAEILRDAGPKVVFCEFKTLKLHTIAFAQGKHISEIVKPTKVHPGKLGMYWEAFMTSCTNIVTSSNSPSSRYESYIQRGLPGSIF